MAVWVSTYLDLITEYDAQKSFWRSCINNKPFKKLVPFEFEFGKEGGPGCGGLSYLKA